MTKAHNWILSFSYLSILAPKKYTAFGLSCAPCIPILSQSQWDKRAVPVDFHRSPPDKSEIIKLHTTEILIISYRHALRLIRNSTPNFRLLPFWFGWTWDGMQHGVVEKRSSFVDATKTTTAKKKSEFSAIHVYLSIPIYLDETSSDGCSLTEFVWLGYPSFLLHFPHSKPICFPAFWNHPTNTNGGGPNIEAKSPQVILLRWKFMSEMFYESYP